MHTLKNRDSFSLATLLAKCAHLDCFLSVVGNTSWNFLLEFQSLTGRSHALLAGVEHWKSMTLEDVQFQENLVILLQR